MGICSRDVAERFLALAKKMLFSIETVEKFLVSSSTAQVRCAVELIAHIQRAGGPRAQQVRQTLPQGRLLPGKSFEGYDFSQVAFPDGYGAYDLMSLGVAVNLFTTPDAIYILRDPRTCALGSRGCPRSWRPTSGAT